MKIYRAICICIYAHPAAHTHTLRLVPYSDEAHNCTPRLSSNNTAQQANRPPIYMSIAAHAPISRMCMHSGTTEYICAYLVHLGGRQHEIVVCATRAHSVRRKKLQILLITNMMHHRYHHCHAPHPVISMKCRLRVHDCDCLSARTNSVGENTDLATFATSADGACTTKTIHRRQEPV